MNAPDRPADLATAPLLGAEWRRVECLCNGLQASRRGEPLGEADRAQLRSCQRQVDDLREAAPWRALAARHRLDRLDQDMLALALAPEVEPRLGWLYQSLQAGPASAYPSPALIQELLGIEPAQAGDFHARLVAGSALQRSGLVELPGADGERSVRPTARLRAALLGWGDTGPDLPGAQRLASTARRCDLVLPEACGRAVDEFLLWVTQRHTVVERWGGQATGGPLALFCGPSGTGKTLAAEVVAGLLGWPVYRVDIGLLVSKYIGETEKNLNALFDAADGEPLLLLFDEADALFGKRGEVREAHDRYANMEVGHLLTRLERHHGPCVLTTNLRQALDPAFTRRFQVVVDFPRPDARARAQLWRLHLPARAPLATDVDCALLGDSVELTGGQIRNAALHAAYLAAGEGEGATIDLPRIARSVWAELGKSGRERVASNLGGLARHLPASATHA